MANTILSVRGDSRQPPPVSPTLPNILTNQLRHLARKLFRRHPRRQQRLLTSWQRSQQQLRSLFLTPQFHNVPTWQQSLADLQAVLV